MLYEVMGWQGPITYRQYLVWIDWSNHDMNFPSRQEYYLMQVACEVRRGWVTGKPSEVTLNDMRLKFTVPKPSPSQTSNSPPLFPQEDNLALAKWGHALGINVETPESERGPEWGIPKPWKGKKT
jgi:hypothetical protein